MREKYRWSTNETGMSLSVQVHSASINSETRIRKKFECSIPAKRSFEKDSSARFRLNDHSKKIRVLDSGKTIIRKRFECSIPHWTTFSQTKKPRSIEPLDNHLELLQIIYYNLVSSSLTRPVSSSTSNSS